MEPMWRQVGSSLAVFPNGSQKSIKDLKGPRVGFFPTVIMAMLGIPQLKDVGEILHSHYCLSLRVSGVKGGLM